MKLGNQSINISDPTDLRVTTTKRNRSITSSIDGKRTLRLAVIREENLRKIASVNYVRGTREAENGELWKGT